MQFEAKTVEEATKKGLESLGIAEEQAEITVIEQPLPSSLSAFTATSRA